MIAYEVNFDGLVGGTHNYAGLSYGNLASRRHGGRVSSPREAALEGLGKMKFMMGLGVKQGVLPPQERPDLETLRRLGFGGTDAQVVERAWREEPALLAACYSASSMWAANAATVSASADTADGRIHFTPANLITQFHRSLEAETTGAMLRAIFGDESRFAHHPPLPAALHFGDEGAANHTRLAAGHGEAGIEVFVYGRRAFAAGEGEPMRFPARQTREACEAMARLHQLDRDRAVFVQQNPRAIDAGAFHNDVVAVGNGGVLFHHAMAFADSKMGEELERRFERCCGGRLRRIEVREEEVSLADAVGSYLFNSQLVDLPDGGMALVCPIECAETAAVRAYLDRLMEGEREIRAVHYVDVRQSMRNGGGPACLRLRVAMKEEELAAMHPGVMLTDALYERLVGWVKRHYRESLRAEDLADPNLIEESRRALDELTGILGLGSVYRFQRV